MAAKAKDNGASKKKAKEADNRDLKRPGPNCRWHDEFTWMDSRGGKHPTAGHWERKAAAQVKMEKEDAKENGASTKLLKIARKTAKATPDGA